MVPTASTSSIPSPPSAPVELALAHTLVAVNAGCKHAVLAHALHPAGLAAALVPQLGCCAALWVVVDSTHSKDSMSVENQQAACAGQCQLQLLAGYECQ